jgi:hypothetical protein
VQIASAEARVNAKTTDKAALEDARRGLDDAASRVRNTILEAK